MDTDWRQHDNIFAKCGRLGSEAVGTYDGIDPTSGGIGSSCQPTGGEASKGVTTIRMAAAEGAHDEAATIRRFREFAARPNPESRATRSESALRGIAARASRNLSRELAYSDSCSACALIPE